MSILEYLPFALAGAGIALRFWLSRNVAQTANTTLIHPAAPVSANNTAPRSVSKPDAQRSDLALA